jgi:hypothetical protein
VAATPHAQAGDADAHPSSAHHDAMPDRRTTTERGLGWDHQRTKRRLLAAHIDGSPCPCLDTGDCGPACPCRAAGHALPMYREPTLNPDGRPLEADHTLARAHGGTRADRLLLSTCNRSRGVGHHTDTAGTPTWWSRDWTGAAGLADATIQTRR